MSEYRVKDLMVPLSEYATVQTGRSLFEAVMALEKAQEEFESTHYRHRAVLILDQEGQVVGKLSQMDVLRALESQSPDDNDAQTLNQLGFGDGVILEIKRRRLSTNVSMRALCRQAMHMRVDDLMQSLSAGEYVEDDTSINAAIYQMLNGNHLSLLATRAARIVGILRLSDVFAAVFHTMKECDGIKS